MPSYTGKTQPRGSSTSNTCSECHEGIKRALRDFYLVKSALEDSMEVFPCTHSWHLQQILSDLYSGMRYLEQIVGKNN